MKSDGGWHIKYNPKPIPDRSHDWDYWHDDCDDENRLCGTAPSWQAAATTVAEIIEEQGDDY
jgi:hypothetical protein